MLKDGFIEVEEGDGTTEEDMDVEKEEKDDDAHRPLCSSKRSTVMNDRTMSMDSKASIYTQNSSRLSTVINRQDLRL